MLHGIKGVGHFRIYKKDAHCKIGTVKANLMFYLLIPCAFLIKCSGFFHKFAHSSGFSMNEIINGRFSGYK